jgi:lauroyl/myristoyl acyltransferase
MSPIQQRILAYLLIFGDGTLALTPALGWKAALTLSAAIASAIACRRERKRRRLQRELREAIAREEASDDAAC